MARKIKFSNIYRSNIGVFDNGKQDNGFLYKERKYDLQGNLLWEIEYTRSGQRETITDYFYNNLNKVEAKEIFYPQDNTLEKTVYKYNDAGEIEEESLYYDKDLFLRQLVIFNEKGKQTAIESYDETDTLTGKETFEYDENDLVKLHRHENEMAEADWEITFFYNDKKLCVKEIHHNIEEERTETVQFEYNEAGKSTRSETHDADGNLTGYVEVTYDENNRPVKYISETMGYSFSKIINQVTYNEAGKVLESEYYDVLQGQLSSRESYIYDEDGNVKTEEQFDLRSQGEKKTHYRLQYSYEYYDEAADAQTLD